MEMYRVFNTESNNSIYEYDILVNTNDEGHTVYTLLRSDGDCWSHYAKGEELITITDTGNGMIYPKKTFIKEVGYDEITELFILLSFINKKERMFLYQGRIEKVEPENIMHI